MLCPSRIDLHPSKNSKNIISKKLNKQFLFWFLILDYDLNHFLCDYKKTFFMFNIVIKISILLDDLKQLN